MTALNHSLPFQLQLIYDLGSTQEKEVGRSLIEIVSVDNEAVCYIRDNIQRWRYMKTRATKIHILLAKIMFGRTQNLFLLH